MGMSRESDNTKSNKVTQCPKLKVFKLMEQKGLDPEKIKLLKEKHKEMKKKHSESRSKNAQELYDSSSTERFQQPKRKSNSVQDIMNKETYYYGGRDVFEDQQKRLQESPSRVSCALKKIIGSEYACVGCLAIAFLVSIVVGLLLVFKVMPSSANMKTANNCNLMKKMHTAKGKRQLNDDYDIFGGRKYREKSSDDGFQFNTFSTATEKKEFGYNEHPEQSSNDEITNILNANEIMGSDNEKLRDFYKRLIETDAEIKRVKQKFNVQSNYLKSRNDKRELERIKRSVNKAQAGTLKQRSHQENRQFNKMRIKRPNNGTDDVYGIVIKEQEIIVYEPMNSRKTFHNNDGKFYKKNFKHPFCKHKQKFDDSLMQNNFELKEKNIYANNIGTSTAEYHKNKMNPKIQNDEVNESSKSNNNEDMNNAPSVKSLDIPSNITMDKENDILYKPENVIRRRRLLVSRKNDKAENVKNGNMSKTLLRKSRSLMSFKEENQYSTIKRDGVNENNYIINGTDFNYGNYKSRRLFQYDKGSTLVSDFVTTSTLNTLNNFTHFHKTSATGELDYNILPEISTVDDPKYDVENKKVDIINKVTKNDSSYNTYLTTKSLTNKTEVKREADSKLVLWDELYDSNESGVKLDYLNSKIRRGGYSKKSKMQKSQDWLNARVRKLMNRRKKSKKIEKNSYELSTKAMNVEESFQSIPNQRKIRTLVYDNDKNMENIFKKLNAKLETVCREAAFAIQNTKNIKVREDKADITTSTLMQRLVRMMRDLIDIQVQEKTCVELPPDLRQFLEWLVPPTEANPQADNLNPDISDYVAAKREYGGGIDKSSDVTEQSLSFDEDTDQAEVDKIQCMETISAVKNLVDQYEGLSSEEKNKLFGVKDYLQRQIQYLNMLAGDVDIENHNVYREPEDRFKRETNKIKHKRKFAKRMKINRFGDFMQRLRMKHTKATTQAMDTSFANNFTVKEKEISFADQIQKNLNDVYNRALEEARRITTEDTNITIT